MNVISSQNRRTLIAVLVTLLVVCEMIAYVATTPLPRVQFFQLYLLGAKRTAADYYPNNDTDIGLQEPLTWYLGVTDKMGSAQLVLIRVKIGNQTSKPPDDQQALESPAPVVAEFMRFMQDNETWETRFVWSVSDAVLTGSATRILTLQINNETHQIRDSSASDGHNFRLIFELWTWQTETNAFEFGWTAGGERRVAWLQVWFNMTSPRFAQSWIGSETSDSATMLSSSDLPSLCEELSGCRKRGPCRLGAFCVRLAGAQVFQACPTNTALSLQFAS